MFTVDSLSRRGEGRGFRLTLKNNMVINIATEEHGSSQCRYVANGVEHCEKNIDLTRLRQIIGLVSK